MPKNVKMSNQRGAMPVIEIKPEDIAIAAGAIAEDTPVYMVNLLCYQERAEYAGGSELPPCSGREAYTQRYVPAFRTIAASEGVKVFWLGAVLAGMVVPAGEHWDDIGIVEYPAFSAFRRIVESSDYRAKAEPHRKAALADWRLIATTRLV
jgi:hypothetical protein